MPSETFDSDDDFSLFELALDPNHFPLLTPSDCDPSPATTAGFSFNEDAPPTTNISRTRKNSIVIEDDLSAEVQPKQKRMRTCTTRTRPFRRIPCKARGMSNKHNPDTAFIHVPIDAPHGLLLSCSSSECAQSGRKFRYCKMCATPVAKRNFPKRHGHGLVDSSNDLKQVDYTSSFVNPSTEYMSCQPCEPLPPASSQSSSTASTGTSKRGHQSLEPPTCTSQQPLSPVITPEASPELSPKERDWLSLLKECPNLQEDTKMLSWIDKVIAFPPVPSVGKNTEENFPSQSAAVQSACTESSATASKQVSPSLHVDPSGNVNFFPVESASDDSDLCDFMESAAVGSFERLPAMQSFDNAFTADILTPC